MSAASELLAARRDPSSRPARLSEAPAGEAEAYAIQAEVMGQLGPIGGWKVGFSRAKEEFTCAPLPQAGIVSGGAAVDQAACTDRGVEAEIAVRLVRDLPPRAAGYTLDEVLAAIGTAHPAIELLQSRYKDVDDVDPFSNLADSLSHYGLVVGEAIPGWQGIDLEQEMVSVLEDGRELRRCKGNPGGPMLPLVQFLADRGAVWAGGLKAGQIVTTGSWTGKEFVQAGAQVVVRFDHCGQVEVRFE